MVSVDQLKHLVTSSLKEVVFDDRVVTFLASVEVSTHSLFVYNGLSVSSHTFTVNSDMRLVTHADPIRSCRILLESLLLGMDPALSREEVVNPLSFNQLVKLVLREAKDRGLRFAFVLPVDIFSRIVECQSFYDCPDTRSVLVMEPTKVESPKVEIPADFPWPGKKADTTLN